MFKKLLGLICIILCVLFTALLISGCNPKTVYSDALNFIEDIIKPERDDTVGGSSEDVLSGTSSDSSADNQHTDDGQPSNIDSSDSETQSQTSKPDTSDVNSDGEQNADKPQDSTSSNENNSENTPGQSIIDGDQGPVVYF